jgi:hypothetical protein
MFDQNAVLDANDVRRDPIHSEAEVRKPPVHDHEVSLGHDGSGFVLQRWREDLDKVEEALTSGRDVRAVLNVVGRPITLGGCVVALIKQCVKRFQDNRLVFGFCSLTHFLFSMVYRAAVSIALLSSTVWSLRVAALVIPALDTSTCQLTEVADGHVRSLPSIAGRVSVRLTSDSSRCHTGDPGDTVTGVGIPVPKDANLLLERGDFEVAC